MAQYGIAIETLNQFIQKTAPRDMPWGQQSVIASVPEYRFEYVRIMNGETAIMQPFDEFETTLFIEEGNVRIDDHLVDQRGVITLPPRTAFHIHALSEATIYLFRGPAEAGSTYNQPSHTFDYRDKYWGSIETIISKQYAGKRLVVRQGQCASLEYHCKKLESYFIHAGKLLLRLRAGRGEDRFFELSQGSSTLTPPGLMHQRGGLEDTVIIEISTRDDDSDSFLVEDGAKQKMPRLITLVSHADEKKRKRICFDIDGLLCTQAERDYTTARPIAEAIALVNKLYHEGHMILLFTARFMGRNENDWRAAYEEGHAFTKKQLDDWGVQYHDLFFGKPNMDIFVDDKGIFFQRDWVKIEQEIRNQLSI